MQVFNYHPVTGEYLSTSIADQSPLEPNNYLTQMFSTTVPIPIVTEPHKTLIFNVATSAWVVMDDFRGTIYYMPDGSQHEITEIGVVIPDGALLLPPPPLFSDLRVDKIADINQSFSDAIASGYVTNGRLMNADIADIQRLKSAYDLAVLAGMTELPVVVDHSNQPHLAVPLTDVLAMVLDLGANYQTLYMRRAILRKQLLDLPDTAAQEDLDAIHW